MTFFFSVSCPPEWKIEGELCYLYKGAAFTYKEADEYCEVITSVFSTSIFDVWELGNYGVIQNGLSGATILTFHLAKIIRFCCLT